MQVVYVCCGKMVYPSRRLNSTKTLLLLRLLTLCLTSFWLDSTVHPIIPRKRKRGEIFLHFLSPTKAPGHVLGISISSSMMINNQGAGRVEHRPLITSKNCCLNSMPSISDSLETNSLGPKVDGVMQWSREGLTEE